VHIPRRKQEDLVVEHDEHIRGDASFEALSRLGTPFRENCSLTTGNASGVNDGACAILLASEEMAREFDLTPRARVVAMATAGVESRIMGIGPAPADRKVLAIAV
jgi:acetyl-CoA acyltransferase